MEIFLIESAPLFPYPLYALTWDSSGQAWVSLHE